MARSLSTPRSAGIAGVLFALLLTTALVLVRLAAPAEPGDDNACLADPGQRIAVRRDALRGQRDDGELPGRRRSNRRTPGSLGGRPQGRRLVLHIYAMRMAAVFTISTATIGLRTGSIPRWLGLSGYAIALVLLLVVGVTPWVELLFPFWILLLSVDTLAVSLRPSRA